MSSTKLKLLALILMLAAHIYTYIPDMPLFFNWIGKISFPLFLFVSLWGFHYTSNKKIYLLRLYIFSITTNIIFTIMERHFIYMSLNNNIFRTYFTICIFILLVESYLCNDKNFNKYLTYYLTWQIIGIIIIQNFHGNGILNNSDFLYTLTGNISNIEGGLVFVVLGVGLYFTKHSKGLLSINYLSFCFAYSIITLKNLVPRLITIVEKSYSLLGDLLGGIFEFIVGISPHYTNGFSIKSLLFAETQWMMVFALPIMLLYNNKKGRGLKYIFYIFYPLHMVIVYYIGTLMQ